MFRIDEIDINRHHSLIVFNSDINPDNPKETKRSSNTCCYEWCDHIELVDLIKFQINKFILIRGYYYSGIRDIKCRDIIQH